MTVCIIHTYIYIYIYIYTYTCIIYTYVPVGDRRVERLAAEALGQGLRLRDAEAVAEEADICK